MRKPYSASAVKHQFWFSEFRKVMLLYSSGKKVDEVRNICIAENLFGAPTTARSIQMLQTVSMRILELPEAFRTLFIHSDLQTQKFIALTAIMNSDSLFFDFVYEVYREKLFMGSEVISDSDYNIYFRDKQVQSEKVASWSESTIKNLKKTYKSILMESGITARSSGNRKILKPILDASLENCLRDHHMELFINALTGVR